MFGQTIAALEKASGLPSADIRLNSEISQIVRNKIGQLGLDPSDTTGRELYQALQNKLIADNQVFNSVLGINDEHTAGDVLGIIQKYITKHEKQESFALKLTVAKRLLKKKAPKTVMKKLGYRSLDSMLRHENVAHIYAAVQIFENSAWRKAFYAQYAKLKSTDFEPRRIAVSYPNTKKWDGVVDDYLKEHKHNILSFKELGQVVILPMKHRLPGMGIMTFLLTVHYMNEIHTYSSFVKLQQVKFDFGEIILQSVHSDQTISAQLAGRPVSWRVVQRYYGRLKKIVTPPASFEPHIQAEDLSWRDAEDALAEVDDSLGFWRDTQFICTLSDDIPVSMNIMDVVLSHCNGISYADRITQFAKDHLWSELMARYLHPENLEASVQAELTGEMGENLTLA